MPSEAGATPAGLPASLHMAVHDSLESAESRWRDAATRLVSTPFQDFDWVRGWFDTVGAAQGWKPCIGELRADTAQGPTVLLVPLCFRRERALRVMAFMGAGELASQAPLIDADFARALTPAHANRLWNALIATLPSVDLVRLRRMPGEFGGLRNPFAQLPRARRMPAAADASTAFYALDQPWTSLGRYAVNLGHVHAFAMRVPFLRKAWQRLGARG